MSPANKGSDKELLNDTTIWGDDLLGRREFGEFLHASLINRTELAKERGQALAVALDGPWGVGKSYLATNLVRMARLKGQPVVHFDAWVRDFEDNPALSLMASIRAELAIWVKKVPVTTRAKRKLSEKIPEFTSKFRRAVVPAGKLLAAGAIKKLTGVGLSELVEAIGGEGDSTDQDAVDVGGTLDVFLEKILEEQNERVVALDEFRRYFAEILCDLRESSVAGLPFLVVVDELDRCRPLYSIALLEGVKHFFGVPGVCFVFSTNVQQLKISIGSVYGAGFDGYGYLRRFFDGVYSVPSPKLEQFVEFLLVECSLINGRKIEPALPEALYPDLRGRCVQALVVVVEFFGLDLRTLSQVCRSMAVAVSGVPKGSAVHITWLVFLTALFYLSPDTFRRLERNEVKPSGLRELLAPLRKDDRLFEYQVPEIYASRMITSHFSELLALYLEWSFSDLRDLRKSWNERSDRTWPGSVVQSILEGAPETMSRSSKYPPQIQSYFRLVRFSGDPERGVMRSEG